MFKCHFTSNINDVFWSLFLENYDSMNVIIFVLEFFYCIFTKILNKL